MRIEMRIINLYLEYLNNYLTVELFAIDNEFLLSDCKKLLELGKILHEKNAQFFKQTGIDLY